MPPVRRLAPALANQIAAGEVVERPAAAVKELVENALDAGARRIEVKLEDGGRRSFEVVDDGSGMSREDALLAIERHTTSKLSSAEDLFALSTFGFRGEALPSIASVSRLTITTRRPEELAATRVEVEGGTVLSVEETGAPAGTRVEVRDLFFNVPARLKFLKARQTELGHVVDWVSHLALANPAVGFTVSEAGRTHLKADTTSDLKERIAQVLGRDLFDVVHPVEGREGDVTVSGYCASPARQNSTSREIITFVNRRFVRDRGLMHAVARAYEGVLQVGRSPAVVLFLDVPPAKVDVNVHPQKLEVRFSEQRAVYDAVARSVGALLATSPWLQRPPARVYSLKPTESAPAGQESSSTPEPLVPPARQLAMVSPALESSWTPRQERVFDALAAWKERHLDAPLADDPPLVLRDSGASAPTRSDPPPPLAERAPEVALRFSDLRYLGQVHRTYLVCESPGGLVLLDQHAAHERVLYEKYRAERAGEAQRGQPLLVPRTLDFPPAEARLVEAALEPLADLGFELSPFGGHTFSLSAAPVGLDGDELVATLRELASELARFGTTHAATALEETLLARMACHTAVRAGDQLATEEARRLLESLDGTPFSAQCPHGRPVVVRFETTKLEEMFARTYEGTSKASGRDRIERS